MGSLRVENNQLRQLNKFLEVRLCWVYWQLVLPQIIALVLLPSI